MRDNVSNPEPDIRLENGLALGKFSNVGMRVDIDNPAFPFRDITGSILTRGVGATDPDWAQIGSSSFSAFIFSLNDVCWINFHIPHDYKLLSPVFLHVHWLPDGTDTAAVKWRFDYMYAKSHRQMAFDVTGITVNAQGSPPGGGGGTYYHMLTETSALTIPGLEPDGCLYVKMTRIANGGTDNANNIFVLTLDVHYQSTNIGTKNRSPDFYA